MRDALRWRIILVAVLVYLAGAATGFFAGGWQAHRTFSDRHERVLGERMRERMKRQLDLTPAQIEVVDPILRQTAQRLRQIRRETGQRVGETMEEAHREMAKHLTPEQREQLEQMKKRHKRILIRRRGGHRMKHHLHEEPEEEMESAPPAPAGSP